MTLTGKTAAMFAAAEALQNPKPGKKREDREGPIHKAILDYLRLALPGAVIHHSPNETDMRGPTAMKMILKARELGTRKGWPDIEILWRGNFWTIEAKAPDNGPSPEQRDCGTEIVKQGGKWGVARSVGDARKLIEAWRKEVQG